MRPSWWLMKYIWPPSVIAGVLTLFAEWQRGDMKTKAILTIFFVPALLCVAGLIFQIAYFVLFTLLSFILSVLGLLLLTAFFSGGGLFCYEKMSGKNAARDQTPYDYDATFGEETKKGKKAWFDDVKWFKK